MLRVEASLECAGFITMQLIENGEDYKPEGFNPAYDLVYEDYNSMIDAYAEEE